MGLSRSLAGDCGSEKLLHVALITIYQVGGCKQAVDTVSLISRLRSEIADIYKLALGSQAIISKLDQIYPIEVLMFKIKAGFGEAGRRSVLLSASPGLTALKGQR